MDRKSSPYSNAASHDAAYPDYDGDGDHKNEDEDTSDNKPHATSGDTLLNKGDMCLRKRTRVPWLESDEQRLLLYKDKMGMPWKDIFKRFPDRTPGAVKVRWHILQEK